MIRKRMIGFFLVAAFLIFPALSQTKKIVFDGQAAFEYDKVLSSDAMQGRMSGDPGGRLAAEYIAGKLKEWGLEPAGLKGFYQPMTYEYYTVAKGATLSVVAHNKERDFVYGEDWRQVPYSGSGVIGADIVFVGYGISAAPKGYDDYSGIDVKDKLVLFAIETPRRFETTLKDEAAVGSRIKAARDHGARGVLTFRSDTQAAGGFGRRGGLEKDIYKSDFVMISLEAKVVDFIFKWQKADPRYFFQQIEATGKPQSYPLEVQSLVNLKVVLDEKRPTENVLAKITGTDKTLRNEYVIVGAHMDHLGVDMAGDVFNGADDNASGTAVVMEAARVLAANKFQPKRTIVFALWAAEEEGLLGSAYYADHPVYPLEKTVANINLDMEGHGTGKVNAGGMYYAPEVWDILKTRVPKDIIDNVSPSRGGPGGSDHTSFLMKGVPAFMVNTAGPHFKTNRVGDVIGLIQPDLLRNSGVFVTAALEALSTDPKVPILPRRKETFFWRYATIVDHEVPALDRVIQAHKDVQDPDVDMQLAAVAEKEGLTGDALRADILKALWAAKDEIAQSKGLTAYGAPGPMGFAMMMGPRGPAKTTVIAGLKGLASIRDDFRWAEVFSGQGVNFICLDRPGSLFGDKGLSDEGKKLLDAVAKANLLLVVRGLDAAQSKALLENAKKPVFLETTDLPDKDVLALVKKTESAVGLILGKDGDAASFVTKVDEARKSVGTDYFGIVNENGLWQPAGKDQMLNVIAEALKAGYPSDQMATLFSGAFLRVLNLARRQG